MKQILSAVVLLILMWMPVLAQKHVSDDALIDQVRVKLANDTEVGGMKIEVEVHQGEVTLKGKVRTDKQRVKAEKLAKKVKGVAGVNNQLVVSPD